VNFPCQVFPASVVCRTCPPDELPPTTQPDEKVGNDMSLNVMPGVTLTGKMGVGVGAGIGAGEDVGVRIGACDWMGVGTGVTAGPAAELGVWMGDG